MRLQYPRAAPPETRPTVSIDRRLVCRRVCITCIGVESAYVADEHGVQTLRPIEREGWRRWWSCSLWLVGSRKQELSQSVCDVFKPTYKILTVTYQDNYWNYSLYSLL